MRLHYFQMFVVAFPLIKLLYSVSILALNCIDCKVEGKIEVHVFTPSMFSKSLLSSNISVFEDFNIGQMGIKKTNAYWSDCLTIWWGDQKTKMQMYNNVTFEAKATEAKVT